MSATTDAGPRILITGGNPDPGEVAAVTVALCALAGGGRGGPAARRHRAAAWPGPGDGYRPPASWTGRGGYQAPASWTAGAS